jgi:hypothetical protein
LFPTVVFNSLTTFELIPPQRPLSVVNGTSKVFLIGCYYFFLWRYGSLLIMVGTVVTPKFLPLSNLFTSALIFEEATIFMALVILPIFLTAFILNLIAFSFTANPY